MATAKTAPPVDETAAPTAPETAADNLTEAQRAAAQYELRAGPPGSSRWDVLDEGASSDLVSGTEHGWDYRFLIGSAYPADGRALYEDRQRLAERKFVPVSGPLYKGPARREHVPSQPTAEVWRRPQAEADDDWRLELARSCLNRQFARAYFRRCVTHQVATRWLSEPLEYAMLVFHGLAKDTKGVFPIPRSLAHERKVIINLARRTVVHPNADKPDTFKAAFAEAAKEQ